MTNVNNPRGASIAGAMLSAQFNTLVNDYLTVASDSTPLFIGDFVKTNNTSVDGIPVCTRAGTAEAVRGIVIGFENDTVYNNIQYRPANTAMKVFVCDDPNIELEIQANGLISSTDIGKNAELSVATGDVITGLSGTQLDVSTISTKTEQLKILQIVEKKGNELGEYVKLRCIILEHELRGSGGAGVSKHNDLLHLTYDTAGHGTGYTGFQRGTTLSAVNPAVTDDSSKSYVVGDLWVNTAAKRSFICLDTTAGAAIWQEIEHSIEDIWERDVSTDQITPRNDGDDLDMGTGNVTAATVTCTAALDTLLADFDTTFAGAMQEGRLAWDSEAGTLQLGMPGGNVNIQLGQENVIADRPRNDQGSQINNGQVVYISGATGAVPLVKLANASDYASACNTIAVATENVAAGQRGYYTSFGIVRDLVLNSWVEGTEVWLDTSDGGLTDTRPEAPNCSVRIGYVIRQHATEGELLVSIDVERCMLTRDVTKEPTGFTAPENVDVAYDDTLRTVTLSGTVNAYFHGEPVPVLTSGWVSPVHSSDPGTYFLVWDGTVDGSGDPVFEWKTPTLVLFSDLLIAYAVYESYKFCLRECHGLMPWQTHKELHEVIGTHKEDGGTLADYVLSSTTVADRRPSVSATTVDDEDLPTLIPALAANGPYTQFELFNADEVSLSTGELDIVPLSTNNPYWNEFTGGAWQQTLMSNNYFMSVWLVAVPVASDAQSQLYRYIWVQGQEQSATVTAQRGLSPNNVSMGTLQDTVPEFSFIVQVIISYQAANWDIEEVNAIDGTKFSHSSSPQGSGLTAVEHDNTMTGTGTVSSPLTSDIFSLTGTDLLLAQATLAMPTGTSVDEFSIDGTLAGNSDDALVTEKAIVTYIAAHTLNGNWTKTGTTLSPSTAGDSIDMKTGRIKSIGNSLVIESTIGVQVLAGTTILQALTNGILSMATDTALISILGGGTVTIDATNNLVLTSDTGTITHAIGASDITEITSTGLTVKKGHIAGAANVNNQTGTTYTVTASDAGGFVYVNNASANVVTLPEDSTEDLEVGFWCKVGQLGAGDTSFATEGTDLLVSEGSMDTIRTQYVSAIATKQASGVWILEGDLKI